MAKSLHARLVAYRPFGARIGILAMPVSFSASMLHNDDGAISIEYSMLSGDAQAFDRELTDGLEVAVEVSDGSGYVEPDNARFVITGRSGKTDDRTRTITYTGQSIGWLLSKAENNDSSHLLTDGDNKGKRPFYSSNPGIILKTLLDENKERGGVATGLTLGFDTAKDAAGSAWARKYTLYYSLGTDLQTILGSLVNGGGCDWRTSGRVLKLWNADDASLSRDLSKVVVLRLARDISEAPFEESIADLASTILVAGDNDLIFRMDNPSAPTPWGKWESYSSQGGVSDKDTAQAFMQSTLDDAARVRGQYTRDVIVSDVDSLPFVDYHPGDWITAPTVSHGEKVRVQEIDLSMRQNEGLTASIALNDIKYDASVRQAKKIKGITGGAALAGSESGTIASTDHDHRVPKAPQGLVVRTDAYIGSDGYAHGLATASWSAVTEATNDTAIEIGSYAIEWRRHEDGAPWRSAGTTDKTQLGFGGLDCGIQVEVRVRAVPTYSDQLGEWSDIVVATVESDTTPCSVPSRPVVSSELGVVSIHWDGKTSAGTSMEADFDHIEVGEGATVAVMQVISATQSGQGDYLVTGLESDSEHTYALRSVDHAGNRSAWSATASVTVAATVTSDEIEQIRKDLADNQAALEDNSAKIAQAQKDILDNAAKTSTAQSTAESAGAAAKTAQGTADDAKTAAKAAQSTADAAKTAASSATTTAGQAKAVADAAQKAAASAQSTADNAETLANTASQAASAAKSDAATAKTTASNASSVATQAKATADQAAQAATDAAGTAQKANTAAAAAAGIANGKADVLIQSSEPSTSMRKSSTLWIDTTGGANTPKRWSGSAWVAVTDKAATDAADAAVKANDAAKAAQSTADKAATDAANAQAQANQAQAAAQKAQTTADGKNLIYRGPTEPSHDGLKPGDLWWKQPTGSTHVTQILTWDGTKFTQFDLAANDIVAVGTISANHLASSSVTTDKLASNSVNADKITSNAVTTDKLAANAVTAAKIKAGTITSDKVAAGQFKGYVFTGAVFQSSESANTGMKLNATALQMWDGDHNQTVYLDGTGKSNLLTGTFQTRTSGHRLRISPDYKSSLIEGDETFVGDGVEFPAYNGSTAFYRYPSIASLIQSSEVGAMSALDLWSGRITKNDPAASMQLQSKPRSKGATGSEMDSMVHLLANTHYDESDMSKKSSAWLRMEGLGGTGASAYLKARSDGGATCEVGMNAYGAEARAYCTAKDANGEVGVLSDIGEGYLHLGGYLGGITSRFTFVSTNWRIYTGASLPADVTIPQTTWSWTPSKYGRYYGVCNADLNCGSIIMHVCNTGAAGKMQVMGYNAGNATYTGDVYVNAIGWLVK
jgi:trimeric autotransporter adhesin